RVPARIAVDAVVGLPAQHAIAGDAEPDERPADERRDGPEVLADDLRGARDVAREAEQALAERALRVLLGRDELALRLRAEDVHPVVADDVVEPERVVEGRRPRDTRTEPGVTV